MRMRSMLVFVAALIPAAAVTAQEAPKPAPEMSQLAFFEGSWTCQGKMMETPMGPAGTASSTAEVRRDLKGHYQTGTIKGTMANMPPFEGRFATTYDTAKKQFVMFWIDDMGAWSQSTSNGWKGDDMVYEGTMSMGGQSMKARDTFSKSGPTGMKHGSSVEMGGKWMPVFEENCTKK